MRLCHKTRPKPNAKHSNLLWRVSSVRCWVSPLAWRDARSGSTQPTFLRFDFTQPNCYAFEPDGLLSDRASIKTISLLPVSLRRVNILATFSSSVAEKKTMTLMAFLASLAFL